MNKILMPLLLFLQTQTIIAQDNSKDDYLKNWQTDIQIWYNSGGWYSLINYYFIGDADVTLRIQDKVFSYTIKNSRLHDYQFYNKGLIKNMGGSLVGVYGTPHTACAYRSYGSYSYLKDMINCQIVMKHNYRLGYGSDFRFTFMKFNSLSNQSFIRKYMEVWLCGDLYDDNILVKSDGTINLTDSCLCDTSSVMTPFFPIFNRDVLKTHKKYKDCLVYRATSDEVYIKASKKDGTLASELIISYDKTVPSFMIIDDKKIKFNCLKKDKKGNWLILERYDEVNKQVIDTISRKIKYL